MVVIFGESTVQLRCKFTLAREQFTQTLEQFTQTLEQFTRARIESLVACALLPARNSRKIIRRSRELFLTWLRMLTGIDHYNFLRLVLQLVSHSQNLCHMVLIH